MQRLPLFPTDLYVFNNDFDQAEFIELCKQEQFGQGGPAHSSVRDIHKDQGFAKLFDWVDECLDTVIREEKLDCDKISITSSWCNVYYAGNYNRHMPHRHSMSYLSAVYYLTDGAPTLFQDPVPYRAEYAQIEVLKRDFNPLEAVEAEAGKLVLFPSWMFHSTIPHSEDFDRWTISFNTMPSGKINHSMAADSKATLEVK